MTAWKDWPDGIDKPDLPQGYEWVCLGQALGIRRDNGEHPWWVRLCWATKDGKRRMLKLAGEYFDTPEQALRHAVRRAEEHSGRRKLKEQAA